MRWESAVGNDFSAEADNFFERRWSYITYHLPLTLTLAYNKGGQFQQDQEETLQLDRDAFMLALRTGKLNLRPHMRARSVTSRARTWKTFVTARGCAFLFGIAPTSLMTETDAGRSAAEGAATPPWFKESAKRRGEDNAGGTVQKHHLGGGKGGGDGTNQKSRGSAKSDAAHRRPTLSSAGEVADVKGALCLDLELPDAARGPSKAREGAGVTHNKQPLEMKEWARPSRKSDKGKAVLRDEMKASYLQHICNADMGCDAPKALLSVQLHRGQQIGNILAKQMERLILFEQGEFIPGAAPRGPLERVLGTELLGLALCAKFSSGLGLGKISFQGMLPAQLPGSVAACEEPKLVGVGRDSPSSSSKAAAPMTSTSLTCIPEAKLHISNFFRVVLAGSGSSDVADAVCGSQLS
ncbi:unnamed protein product, partial [Prorocentrum cordatum]